MAIRRIKKKLRYKKERVLLSDTLPYELPLMFSNRGFYRFLVKNGIEIDEEDTLKWSKTMPDGAFALLKLLMGLGDDVKKKDGQKKKSGNVFLNKSDEFEEIDGIDKID